MTKEIQLTQGKFALVDDEDFEYLNQWKWCCIHNSYAGRMPSRKLGKRKPIMMHRIILNTPEGMDTDHINGNGLDDRKCNLRICTHQQNIQNQKLRSSNTSGYKGVSWVNRNKKWKASIKLGNTDIWLGGHDILEDAARAYDEKAKELFGEYANVNFKEENLCQ